MLFHNSFLKVLLYTRLLVCYILKMILLISNYSLFEWSPLEFMGVVARGGGWSWPPVVVIGGGQ